MNEVRVRVGSGGGVPITVDSELSLTSVNPVQNKVITAELENKAAAADLAAVATSGAYSDLSGTPSFAAVATSGAYSDLSGTPSLAAVATSGAYSDLSGTPGLAAVATSGSYTDLSDKPSIPAAVTVDDALSVSSENPVQNKVITAALAGVSSWITSVPEMHRNIFRGQSLGSTVTAAQLATIEDGSFDDLYVGDYWTINNTVYRIADMDFFRTDANSPFVFTTHHLVIVPDGTMYKAKMNDSSATTSGGYKNSDMRTTNLSAAKTTINADFPDMVLTYKDLLVTATSSGIPTASDYFDCDIELMSETMLFGGYVNAKPSNPPYFCVSANPTQFALFRLDPQFIITDKSETIWLRDAADGACFCTMEYSPFGRGANYAGGAVRPFFLIGDAT